jgi:hypothetical protein
MLNQLRFYTIVFCREFTHQNNNATCEPEDMEVALDQLVHDREILTRVLQMAVTKKPLWIGK